MSDTNEFRKIPLHRQPYAKPQAETFSVQVNTKITPSLNQAFNRVCKALNRTPAELIRLLIEEEVRAWEVAQHDDALPLHKSDTKDTPTSSKQTPKRSPSNVRFTYAPWKHPVKSSEGDLYCKFCDDWFVASSFKRRHAEKHGYADTREYIRENIATINHEYERVTGRKPVYNPHMLD
jgi:hypothetical protein